MLRIEHTQNCFKETLKTQQYCFEWAFITCTLPNCYYLLLPFVRNCCKPVICVTLHEVSISGFAVVRYIRGAVLIALSFPSLAKTANTFVSGKLNVSLKEYQKNQLCRNIIARPTIQFGGIIPELFPQTGRIAIANAFISNGLGT